MKKAFVLLLIIAAIISLSVNLPRQILLFYNLKLPSISNAPEDLAKTLQNAAYFGIDPITNISSIYSRFSLKLDATSTIKNVEFAVMAARVLGIEDKVIFVGTVPYVEVPRYISIFDAGLIPFKKNEITENAVPLKLFEYLYMGKPVISTKLRGIVENLKFNNVYFYNAVTDFKTILKKLRDNYQKVQEKNLADYSWEELSRDIEIEMEMKK